MKSFVLFLKRMIIPSVIIAVTFLLQMLASDNQDFVEKYYSEALYPYITKVVTFLWGWIPFSISEIVLLMSLPIALVFLILLAFRRIKFLPFLSALFLIGSFIYAWFYISWGFNYFRLPMNARIGVAKIQADSTQIKFALLDLIKKTNADYLPLDSLNKKQVEQEIELCYTETAAELGIDLPGGRRHPKKIYVKSILDKTMVSGVFSPFFHEVHVNMDLLPIEYPMILAHEKAHQMGIANEAEANFLAYLTCDRSQFMEIRYSAEFSLLGRLLRRAAPIVSDYDSLRAQIRPEVIQDFKTVRDKWLRHAGVVADVSYKTYDKYLKANQISEGIDNYLADVDLLIQWQKKRKQIGDEKLKQP